MTVHSYRTVIILQNRKLRNRTDTSQESRCSSRNWNVTAQGRQNRYTCVVQTASVVTTVLLCKQLNSQKLVKYNENTSGKK